jgi:hypothetical protein
MLPISVLCVSTFRPHLMAVGYVIGAKLMRIE